MRFFQEIYYIIWSNFDVFHLDWIATDVEQKFKYRLELEFDLNSNGI
jgi:hypothetical protein